MDEVNAQSFDPQSVHFGTRPGEVVHARHTDVLRPLDQAFGERASHETTDSGNKYSHLRANGDPFKNAAIVIRRLARLLSMTSLSSRMRADKRNGGFCRFIVLQYRTRHDLPLKATPNGSSARPDTE